MENKVEELKKLLNQIGWDIKGNYPNRWIFDHEGKKTYYSVRETSIEVIGVSEHTLISFMFSGSDIQMVGEDAVSVGTEKCFILFMNHNLNKK